MALFDKNIENNQGFSFAELSDYSKIHGVFRLVESI